MKGQITLTKNLRLKPNDNNQKNRTRPKKT